MDIMSQQSTMSIAPLFLSPESGMMIQQALWPGSVTKSCLIPRSRTVKKSAFASSRLTVLRLTSELRIQAPLVDHHLGGFRDLLHRSFDAL